MFLNARLNSEKFFSCKILNSFKSFVDFFECRRGKVYGGRGDCSAGVVVDKLLLLLQMLILFRWHVLKLLMRPACEAHEPELVALAYAQFYDQRAGAIEVEIREDKQGVGITRRRKKRAAAQAMLTLLGTLAHNVLVWAREWLGAAEPRLKQYGIVRLLRDVLCVRGFVEADDLGESKGVVLNRGSTLARLLAAGLRELLQEQSVTVSLGGLSD
jgi:hypothetical protein